MSILAAVCSALSTGVSTPVSATWADIVISSPAISSENSNVTLTIADSDPRTFQVIHDEVMIIRYRINSGTYVICPSGTTFEVSNGDDLNFRANHSENGTTNITVYDVTQGQVVDTFAATASGF